MSTASAGPVSRSARVYATLRTQILDGGFAPGQALKPQDLADRLGVSLAVVDVPIPADEKLLEVSASRHGVLWTPMSFFYTDGGTHSLRLSCSGLDPDTLEEGVRRLATLLRESIA